MQIYLRMASLRQGGMLISFFLQSTGGQGFEQRHLSLTVKQRDRILWGRPLCTIIIVITKATDNNSNKQFQQSELTSPCNNSRKSWVPAETSRPALSWRCRDSRDALDTACPAPPTPDLSSPAILLFHSHLGSPQPHLALGSGEASLILLHPLDLSACYHNTWEGGQGLRGSPTPCFGWVRNYLVPWVFMSPS